MPPPDLPPALMPTEAAREPPQNPRHRIGPLEFERLPDGHVAVHLDLPPGTFTAEELLRADTAPLVTHVSLRAWDWTSLLTSMAGRNADRPAHVLAAGFHQVEPQPAP